MNSINANLERLSTQTILTNGTIGPKVRSAIKGLFFWCATLLVILTRKLCYRRETERCRCKAYRRLSVDMAINIECNKELNEFHESLPQKPWISLRDHSLRSFCRNRYLVCDFIYAVNITFSLSCDSCPVSELMCSEHPCTFHTNSYSTWNLGVFHLD